MNKKILYTAILLSFIFTSFILYNENNFPKDGNPVISFAQINGNNISTYFQNNGVFNRDPFHGNGAFEWPTGSSKFLRYASGLWIGAKVGNDTLIAVTVYSSEYLPGFININGEPEGKDDPNFKVYKIVKGDTLSKDYMNWPVSQGAYLDTLGKPIMPGTQTIFYSYTDGYPEAHTNNGGSTAPLKAQVQVTTWCYNDYPPTEMRNVLFSEFKIINKNSLHWNDSYFTIWSDDTQDEHIAIGSDSTKNLIFSYCFASSQNYGLNPPSYAFLLLKGPEVYTGNPYDTVYSFIPGQSQRKTKIGYKEIKLSSTQVYNNADPINGDPHNYKETYVSMQGIRRSGTNWINPITNTITKFPYSGDPESGTGWNQFTLQGFGNRRLQMNIGNLNLNPGDTQTIVIAQIVSQGTTNLNSVTKLKQSAEYVQNVFDNNFTTVGIDPISNSLPSEFNLHQNYPNPFNPKTIINYELGIKNYVSLKLYDVLGNEVVTLVNEKQSTGSYKVEFDGSNFASGVYFYKLEAGNFSETKRMILLK